MKIVFEGVEFGLEQVNDLNNLYPESHGLIDFIKNWNLGATIFHFSSSGSTGKPKRIEVHRSQIVASVTSTSEFLSLRTGDKVLMALNPHFIAAKMMVARCMIMGMDLHLMKPSSNPLAAYEKKVDFISLVPFQVYNMIEDGNIERLLKIRNVLIGGAPLTATSFDRLARIDTNIYLTYGMTETVSHIALMPVRAQYVQASYQLLPGNVIRQAEDGCLRISGAVTNNEWIHTNDIIELIDDQHFRWLGRKDHVINSGGIKIHPEQLERLLEGCLDLTVNFMISWMSDKKLGAACILILEKDDLADIVFEEVQTTIAKVFSKFHIPRRRFTVNEFQRTASGKIIREATRINALKLKQ